MGGLEQDQSLSLGILIDIVDEQWMRDTLPADGTRAPFPLRLTTSPNRSAHALVLQISPCRRPWP